MFFKNATGQGIYVEAYNTSTQAVQTGDAANITAVLSIDGGTTSSIGDTNPTEIGGGIYWFDFTQAETNADSFALIATSTTANVVIEPVVMITDGGVMSDGSDTRVGSAGTTTGLVRGQDTDSLEDVADAVVDEDLSGHTIDGTLGEVLTAINTLTDKLEGMVTLNGEGTLYQYTEDSLELAPSGTSTGATAQEVWEYTTRTVTGGTIDTNNDMRGTDGAVTDISSLATSAEISALNNISPAQVNSEVLDVMTVDARTEPGQATPAHTISIAEKVDYLFKKMVNKNTTDGDIESLYNSDGITVDQTQTVSDDGSTATKGAMISGT
jgi:hypothetical protein